MSSEKKNLLSNEELIGNLLRIGVLVSSSIIIYGMLLGFNSLRSNRIEISDLNFLLSINKLDHSFFVPHTLIEMYHGLISYDSTTYICLGLLTLIALPLLRVILLTIIFIVERDFVYVGFSLIVLSALFLGIFLGKEL